MKKVLVTGKSGYIGTKFKEWIEKNHSDIKLEYISVRGEEWENKDFSEYDTILHLAGIAHVSRNPKFEELYYKINRDLTIKLAEKAKKESVRQFIFMSSIIVYGQDNEIGNYTAITKDTVPNPSDFYGDSKLQADLFVQKMRTDSFKTLVIRTPIVYGPSCKGNFDKIVKLSKFIPLFPSIDNKKSMIFIDNLCNLLEKTILSEEAGIIYPQNNEYVSTKDIVKVISELRNKKTYEISIFNPLIKIASKKIKFINKIFGNKFYDKKLDNFNEYQIYDFKESIKKSI